MLTNMTATITTHLSSRVMRLMRSIVTSYTSNNRNMDTHINMYLFKNLQIQLNLVNFAQDIFIHITARGKDSERN